MKRFLLLLIIANSFFIGVSAQTTFTTTLAAAQNWNNPAIWVKTGAVSNATFPGATGYAGELPGDIHNVIILTTDATARVLTLNVNTIVSHVGDVTFSISPGVATLALGNNNLPLLGSVSGAGTITFGSGTLSLTGDLIGHTGTFTVGTGTVNYNGINQTIKSQPYNNLTLSNSGIKTVNGNFTVSGNLLVNSGTTLDLGALATTFTTTGTSTINGTLEFGTTVKSVTQTNNLLGNGNINMTGVGLAHTLSLSGTANSFSGTLNTTDASASTITYAPNADQTVFTSPNYQNLVLSATSGTRNKTLNGDITVKGNLSISANAALNFGATIKTTNVNGNLSGVGSITMQGAGIAHALNLYGATNTIAALNTTASSGSTIAYLALGNQTVFASASYQNINFGGSGIKTFANADVTAAGNVDISGCTLAINASALRTITINGNLSGNGVLDMSGGNFAHVLNLGGSNNSIGTLTTPANVASLVNYTRNGNQQIFASLNYKALTSSGSGVKSFQGNSNVNGVLTTSGTSTLSLNSYALGLDGNVTVNAGSTLSVNSNAVLSLTDTKGIFSAGNISVVGTPGNLATVTCKGGVGGYSINQNGATSVFSASNYHFQYLKGALTIANGTINATNNFSDGSFSSGVGGFYLVISTPIDLTALPVIKNTVFNAGTTLNVNRTTGTGKITFEQSSGSLAGEAFDNDNGNPGTLIDWTFPGNIYYSKGNLPAGLTTSWSVNSDGSGASPSSVTDGVSSFIIRDGHTMTLDNNGDMKALALQVGQGVSGGLVIGQTVAARTLTIQNDLTVMGGGSISMGAAGTHSVKMLSGSIINNGTIDFLGSGAATANVILYGDGQIKGAVKPKFSNLTLETTAITTLGVDVDVAKNLLFKLGSKFNDGGRTISIGGNYDNLTGVTTNVTCTGTALFYGLSSTISNGTTVTSFNNLTFTSSNGSISESVVVKGDFLLTNSGTVIGFTGKTLTLNKGFQVDGGTTFTSNGLVDFASTLTQSILLDGTALFNTLNFTNGGLNSKNIIGDFTATGAVTQSSNTTLSGAGTYTISGNLTVDGTCNWSGKIIQKGGSIRTTNASNALSLGTAELEIQGGVALNFGAPATSVAVTVSNNVTVTSGNLDINSGATLVGQPANTFKVNTLLRVRGTNNFPSGFGTYDLAPNVTAQVSYDQNINQTIRGGITYGVLNLDSSNGGVAPTTKTVDAPLDVNGNFTLGTSTTLDLGSFSHTFAGNITLTGSSILSGPNASLSLDAPDANQNFGGGTMILNNLFIDQSSANATRTKTLTAGTIFNLSGNFQIANSSGSPSIGLIVVVGANSITAVNGVDLPNDFIVGSYCQLNTTHADFHTGFLGNFLGTINFDVNSTINFNAAGDQLIPDGFIYGNVMLSGSGTKTARGSLDINGNMTGGGGSIFFNDNGFNHALAGNWSLNGASYGVGLGVATGTITLDGVNQTIAGSIFNNLIVANSGLADVNNDLTLLGNIVVNNNANIDFSIRNLRLSGNFTAIGSGAFIQSTGTTTFIGAGVQNINSNGSSVFGNFVVTKPLGFEDQKVVALSAMRISGATTISIDAGILDITNQTVDFGGTVLINDNDFISSTNFIADGATVRINGVTSQYFRTRSGYPIKVQNIYFSGSGNKVFGTIDNTRAVNVPGNDSLIVMGNFEIAGANVNNASGVLNGTSNIYLYGDWINTGTFSHPANGTVYFMGVNQNISASDFYNFNVKGSGVKTLSGPIKVNNNLILTAANLDCNDFEISVGAAWNNTTGAFTPRTSTVVFTGTAASNITTGATGITAGKGFYNVEINKSTSVTPAATGSATLAGDLEVQNNLLLSSNTFTTGIYDLWIKGNFDNQGGVFAHTQNTSIITLNATSGEKIFRPSYPSQPVATTLRGVVVNAPGATYKVESDFTIQQIDMNVLAGDFILNKHILNVTDPNRRVLINGGKLHVDSSSVVNFINTGSGITLNSGELHIVGNSVNTSKLSSSAGSFTVNQTGGKLNIGYYDVLNGLFIITGGTLDATDNFSNGSFSGYNAGGATTAYINLDGINLGAGLTLNNVVFNAGTTAAITPKYNVYRSTGTGAVNLTDAVGSYAGQTYEKDNGVPGTLVNWTYPAGFFWDGGGLADESWENQNNWSSNQVPGPNDIAYIDHKFMLPSATPYKVRITSGTATAKRLMMDAQGGGNIEVIIQSGAKLAIVEDVQILTNNTLTQTDATALLTVGTSWTNTGVFNHGNSTVTFNGTGGISNISAGGVGAGKAFYNLTINAPSSTYSLTNAAKIDGNVTISKGTFDLYGGNNDVIVGGNWFVDLVNGGVFQSSTADVTFNGINQSITNGDFYNLITSNSGTKSLLSNLRVKNNVTIGASTIFDGAAYDLYVGGSWINNGNFLQTGLGGVTFDGNAAQSLDNGGLGTTFNHLSFTNAGVKTLYKNEIVNGDVNINPGSGIINLDVFTLTGNGASNSLTSNATIEVRGANNFPTGFETINLAAASNVSYISNLAQNVYATTYGNISFSRVTAGTPTTKTALGDLIVAGGLTVNVDATLNMATNDASITLSGGMAVATGGYITWGTTNSTLTHIGGDITLDKDVTSYNNLVLAGTDDKSMGASFTMTGDLRVKSGVDLFMGTEGNQAVTYNITGDGTNSIIVESNGRVLNTRPSSSGPAIPENFANYNFDSNSIYLLWGNNSVDQTIYTGSPSGTQIVYGNVYNGNTKTVTIAGNYDLRVDGNFQLTYTANSFLVDGGKNIEARGANVYLCGYTPSPGVTFTLNGNANQNLRNTHGNTVLDNTIDFSNVIFGGGGTKTLGDGNDDVIVSGNWTINNNIIVTSSRNIAMGGSSWINNGSFTHTGGTVTFNGGANQTINPGISSAINYFNGVLFDNTSVKTFVTNGADVNSTFTISAGTVDLGNLLFYNLAGHIINVSGGSLLSSFANITLDGGNQNIQTPNFAVANITTSGNGTKRLFSNWTIGGNLLINSGTTLNTSDNLVPTISNISLGGHWVNYGTYTGNSSTVTFNSILTDTDIFAGNFTAGSLANSFYNVVFGSNASNYKLWSPTTRFSRSMVLGANAQLSLNENTLILGSNIASGKTFEVSGLLNINKNAYLKFNNQTSKSVMTIKNGGTLNVVGLNSTTLATITRDGTAAVGAETQITVESGATLAAKYYLIEFLQTAGMDCQPGSILDPINNLSEGNWANVPNLVGAKYIRLESNYSGGDITNCTFSFTATPTVGTNYNVERVVAVTPITFASIGGALGSYKYEIEADAPLTNALTGLLRWPAVTESNWTGAQSTDWFDPLNWDNGVPTSTIDALISDKANDPEISAANASCKKLEISNGQLTLKLGKTLTTTSDVIIGTGALGGQLIVGSSASIITVGGSWKRGTAGVFAHGGGSVLFNSASSAVNVDPGNQKFNNVTFDGASSVFNLIGTAIVFDGFLSIQNGEVVPASNNYTHIIKGDFYTKLGAIFTPLGGSVTSGTITMSGANQTITNGILPNLVVAGTGIKKVSGVTLINGAMNVTSNLEAISGAPITWKGNVLFSAGSSFTDGGETHQFYGTTWNSLATYNGSGTVVFKGTGANQAISNATFYNLTIDCSSATYLDLTNDIVVNNNLFFTSKPSYIFLRTFKIVNTLNSGEFNVADNELVYVNGVNNFPSGFSTYTLSPSSTIRYAGTIDQTIANVSYGNLYLQNATTKTLAGNTAVKGALTFTNSTLDVSTNNYSLNISGQWVNNASGVFIPRQGTVVFDGSNNQDISVGASNANDFYNLTIANSGSGTRVLCNWPGTNLRTIFNNLTVSSGVYNANSRMQTVGGDLVVSGTGLLSANNNFTLNKASGTAQLATNGSILSSIVFNGNATYNVLDDITVLNAFTQHGGTFNGNGISAYLGDNGDVITINGTYIVGAGGKMLLGGTSGVTVGLTGRFELIGSAAGIAMVTNNPQYAINGWRYTFTVNGTIAAKNYAFEWMGGGGITLSSSATIDAINNLSDGTFTNGAGSQPLLVVQNNQSFISPNYISNVTFPTNAGGTAKNVKKTSATGVLEFYNATGLFAGDAFEDDPNNLVNWTGPLTLTWNGSVGTDWNNASNWSASIGLGFVPTGAEDVIIPAGMVNMPILTTSGQKTANLKIDTGAKITLNTPADAGAIDLNVNGDLNLKGTVVPQSVNDYINLTGSWTKSGTGASVLGTVSFNGTGSSKTINNGVGAFNFITIGGSTIYQIATLTTINNDLVILPGATFGSGANQLLVNGNWNNTGTFLPSTGTVRLKSTSGAKSIKNGTSLFNNIEINGPTTTYQLLSNINVNGNLDLTKGTLDLNNFTLKVGDNSGSDFFNISDKVVANGTSKINMVGSVATPAQLIVYNGGWLDLVGTNDLNVASIFSSTNGRYDLSIESGAKLSAKYYSVANTTSAGFNIKSGATVSPAYNLSNGTFSNGLGGYTYLTLGNEMAVNDTIRSVVFNAGAQYNVTRSSGTTEFAFVDAGGPMGGYTFENDLGGLPDATTGLLRWDTQSLYTWLGLSDNWSTPSNWFNSVLPNSLASVTIKSGTPFSPIIKTGANVTIGDLNVQAGSQLTVANGAKLTINGASTIDGSFIIQNQPDAMASVMAMGTVTGNVQIETTIPANRYYYMGNSVSNLNSGIYNAADAVNSWAYKLNNGAWLRYTDNVTPLESSPLIGYSHKFLSPKTITAVGPLNNSNYTVSVPSYSWYLVANPYSATVDLALNYNASLANWIPQGGNIDPNIWLPTHGVAAGAPLQFATYNLSSGLNQNGGSKFIAPQQAFWIRNPKLTNGTFAMALTARIHDTTVKLKSIAPVADGEDVLRVIAQNSFASDEVVFAFRNSGLEIVSTADSEKKSATDAKVVNIYSYKENRALAINCLPEVHNEIIIPLGLNVGVAGAGTVKIMATNITNFFPNLEVWIDDVVGGISYNLREVGEISISLPSGSTNSRYKLRLLPSTIGVPTIDEGELESTTDDVVISAVNQQILVDIDSEEEINALIDVYNTSGQLIARAKSHVAHTEIQLPTYIQIYMVRVVNNGKVKSAKVVTQ